MQRFLSWLQTIEAFPKRYLGIAIGFLLWIVLEFAGFFPTLLLVVFMAIGYAVGRLADSRQKWQDVIEKIWKSDRDGF